jgi:predicted ABC-type ATPase
MGHAGDHRPLLYFPRKRVGGVEERQVACIHRFTVGCNGGSDIYAGFRVRSGCMEVYVIAGPNGAGKTTFAREFLPKYAKSTNFVNADLIAQGIAPFSPEAAAVRAGKLVLGEIRSFVKQRVSFAFETTLSGRGYLNLIRQLRRAGYKVHIFFLWVDTVEISSARIRERVLKGGHDVPVSVQRRRFARSIRNFLMDYRPLADFWYLFENSQEIPRQIAVGTEEGIRIMEPDAYSRIMALYGVK